MEKYRLIKLPKYNIIVSNELPKDDELCLVDGGLGRIGVDRFQTNVKYTIHPKKLIASTNPEHNLPSIDWNGLEEKFGIVDVEQMAVDFAGNRNLGAGHGYPSFEAQLLENGFVKGFKKSQEINDNRFSLEDVIKIAEYVRVSADSTPEAKTKTIVDEYLSMPCTEEAFDIKIEMERWDGNALTPYEKRVSKPKITDNKIKILK